MSQQEIERLIGDLSTSDALRDRLTSVGDDFDAALVTARDAGYAIDADAARAYLRQTADAARSELNEAQLDAVTGGNDVGAGQPTGPLSSFDAAKEQARQRRTARGV